MTFKRFERDQHPLPWLQKKTAGEQESEEPRESGEPPPRPQPQFEDTPSASESGRAGDSTRAEAVGEAASGTGEDHLSVTKLAAGDLGGLEDEGQHHAGENGAALMAPAPSTTTRVKLSEILRDVESVSTAPPPATSLSEVPPATSETASARTPEAVDAHVYPTLLEPPRDGKTQPFIDMMPEAMADDVDEDFKELESLPKARDPLAAAGPAPYVAPPPTRQRRFQTHTAGRVPWRLVSIVFLALSLAGFIGAFTSWVLTAEDSASEVNRRIAAELTEIDLYLATHQEAIAQAEPDEQGRIALPDFPTDVTVSAEEAALPPAELREVILDDAADLMYAEGVEAYGADSGVFDDFSTPGLVHFGIEMMQESSHNIFLVLSVLTGVITAAAAVAVFVTSRGSSRLVAFGSAVAAAGGIALLISLLMRLIFDRAASREGDELASGLGDIAIDVSFLFTRNSLAFLAVGLVILTAGFVIARLDRPSTHSEARRQEPAKVA
jgi:hypothetical protein